MNSTGPHLYFAENCSDDRGQSDGERSQAVAVQVPHTEANLHSVGGRAGTIRRPARAGQVGHGRGDRTVGPEFMHPGC